MHAGVVESAVVGYQQILKARAYMLCDLPGIPWRRNPLPADITLTVSRIIGPIAKPDKISLSRSSEDPQRQDYGENSKKIAEGETDNLGDISTLLDPGI
jgi:acetyl-CoA synthetase